jgi:hypothetical protein
MAKQKFEIVKAEVISLPITRKRSSTKYNNLAATMTRMKPGDYIIVEKDIDPLKVKQRLSNVKLQVKRKVGTVAIRRYEFHYVSVQSRLGRENAPDKLAYDIILKRTI